MDMRKPETGLGTEVFLFSLSFGLVTVTFFFRKQFFQGGPDLNLGIEQVVLFILLQIVRPPPTKKLKKTFLQHVFEACVFQTQHTHSHTPQRK
jgi:hypothetical protein